ncbi:MAG: pyridoxal 5'-phosphate synthase glutaminase subunit PdxT [Candidatus Xenobia bacterium]
MIGILALQGDVAEHAAALQACGEEPLEVRDAAALKRCRGLIIPGGESTTIGKLLERYGILHPLQEMGASGFPIYGTCAGMILLAKAIQDGIAGQQKLGLLDVTAVRNAYGRQQESFVAEVSLPAMDGKPFPAVFIRAPKIAQPGPQVEVLGKLDGAIVAVRQGNVLATTFHPELSGDTRVHRYFASMCRAPEAAPAPVGAPSLTDLKVGDEKRPGVARRSGLPAGHGSH